MTVQYQGVWSLQSAAQLQSTQRWVTDPLYKNTTLLLQADDAANGAQNNTFLDSSGNALPIARLPTSGPNAPTQGTFTPFSQASGYWSNYFDGTGDYLLTALTGRSLGTGSFTVQCYFNISALTSGYIVISSTRTGGGSDGTSLTVDSATQKITITTSGSVLYTGRTVIKTNQWYHLAYVRNGSSACSVYIDGVLDGTFTDARNFSGTQLLIGGGEGGNAELNGYISNYSITNTAVYTAAFTPPNTPTTSAVVILTCQSNRFVDNSGNNFTFTIGGTPSVQAFSPFAPQFQWTPSVIGGSGYFDGSTDNIQTSIASPNLSIGTGDFTFECWVYLLSASGDPGIMQLAGSPFGTNQPTYSNSVGVIATTGAGLWALINNGSYTNGSISRVLNTWTHLAICRSGTTHRLFVNGVQAVSVSDSSNYTTQYFAAGCAYGTNFPSNAYISNIRFVRGTAVYTGAFTPPTRPLSASGADSASAYPSTTNVNTSFAASATSLFLNFTNAGIFDGTMKNVLETVGNAQISTAVVKYGSGSMYFDGTGDLLFSPASQNYSFPGDFTIECWINTSTISTEGGSYRRVFATGPDAVTSLQLVFSDGASTSGNLSVVTSTFVITGTINAATGTWVHVALTRLGSSMRLFINGVQSGSTLTTTQAFTGGASNGLFVGSASGGTGRYLGYIDDFRITQGIARYTQNFIPPSVALPRQ